jgi:hypothetical protein
VLSAGVDLSGLFDPEDRGRVVDLRGLPAPERRGVPGIGAMLRAALKCPNACSERVSAVLDGRV